MNHTKKLLMTLSIGLLALAFAIPASASAYSNWTINGAPSETTGYEEFSGKFKISPDVLAGPGAGSTLHCDATFTVETNPESAKGQVSSFEFTDLNACEGTGVWANCIGTSYEEHFSGAPINMGASPTSFGGGGFELSYTVYLGGAGCSDWVRAPSFSGPQEMTPILNEQGTIVGLKLRAVTQSNIVYSFGTLDATGKYAEEFGELGLE
jgi:hypothetical protein